MKIYFCENPSKEKDEEMEYEQRCRVSAKKKSERGWGWCLKTEMTRKEKSQDSLLLGEIE